jgi:hypothetical protein
MAGKWRAIAGLWGVALAMSAALALAGRRWPDPLVPQAALVWLLLLLPSLATLAWLLRGWSLDGAGSGDPAGPPPGPPPARRRPDGQEGESEAIQREQR